MEYKIFTKTEFKKLLSNYKIAEAYLQRRTEELFKENESFEKTLMHCVLPTGHSGNSGVGSGGSSHSDLSSVLMRARLEYAETQRSITLEMDRLSSDRAHLLLIRKSLQNPALSVQDKNLITYVYLEARGLTKYANEYHLSKAGAFKQCELAVGKLLDVYNARARAENAKNDPFFENVEFSLRAEKEARKAREEAQQAAS